MLRPRRALVITLTLAAFSAWAFPAHAQTIQGTLRDRETNNPIGYGRLVLVGERGDSVASVLANRDGLFSITASQPGGYYLRASAIGYKDTTAGIFDLDRGGSISLEFRIYPVPITLEGVVATLPQDRVRPAALIRNGFYDRMTGGMGRFLTPADIDKAHVLRSTDLFFGIPRVFVQGSSQGDTITMLSTFGECAPMLYVDGILVSRAPTDRDMPSITDIEAIEVYRGAAEVPLQWGGTAAQGCGVIVLWTKGM
jgi:hypothetical protein